MDGFKLELELLMMDAFDLEKDGSWRQNGGDQECVCVGAFPLHGTWRAKMRMRMQEMFTGRVLDLVGSSMLHVRCGG